MSHLHVKFPHSTIDQDLERRTAFDVAKRYAKQGYPTFVEEPDGRLYMFYLLAGTVQYSLMPADHDLA